MALTMTRTRTQTTLTKLATMVANVHGELEFVEALLAQEEAEAATAAGRGKSSPEQVVALRRRKAALEEKRQALYLTLRQFDPDSDPRGIDSDPGWLKKFGRGGGKTAVCRYLRSLQSNGTAGPA
jgi:hypothetical protein